MYLGHSQHNPPPPVSHEMPTVLLSPTFMACFAVTHCVQHAHDLGAALWNIGHLSPCAPLMTNDRPSLSSHHSPIATHLVVKPHESLPHPLSDVAWLAFVQVTIVSEYVSHALYSR